MRDEGASKDAPSPFPPQRRELVSIDEAFLDPVGSTLRQIGQGGQFPEQLLPRADIQGRELPGDEITQPLPVFRRGGAQHLCPLPVIHPATVSAQRDERDKCGLFQV